MDRIVKQPSADPLPVVGLLPSRDPLPRRHFADADFARIRDLTFVRRVEFHPTIDSTNQRAAELARESTIRAPVLVLAESQTKGRGRGSNQWWADHGALTFTLLLDTGFAQRHLPQASLTVGLAVCEAVEEIIDAAIQGGAVPPGLSGDSEKPEVQLKWPNDVYCRQRKLCGILIELPTTNPQLLAIGIGINVNNSVRHAPQELQTTAVALCDIIGQDHSLVDVLIKVLNHLENRLGCIGHDNEALRSHWRQRCLLTGRKVEIDLGARVVSGHCRGINDAGALVIETVNGPEQCFAGTITAF